MNDVYMTVADLKRILENLPDEMPIVIPDDPDENYNITTNCAFVRTAGILSSDYEEMKVLCLNTTTDDSKSKISDQIDNVSIRCEEVLF